MHAPLDLAFEVENGRKCGCDTGRAAEAGQVRCALYIDARYRTVGGTTIQPDAPGSGPTISRHNSGVICFLTSNRERWMPYRHGMGCTSFGNFVIQS